MKGRDLDSLVAQARGWKLRKYANGGGEWAYDGKIVSLSRYGKPVSTDIAEAMALVEELGRWHGFEFIMWLEEDGQWHAGWFENDYEGPESRVTARSKVLPEAICLAYLKAKGVEV